MIKSKKLGELLKRELDDIEEVKAIMLVNKKGGVFSIGMNGGDAEMSKIYNVSSILVSTFCEYSSRNQAIKDLYLECSNGKFIIGHSNLKNLLLVVWFDYSASIGKVHLKFNNINNALIW
ncbi:hypothetical protein OJ253_2947 [Cryptosporidium canis]|uniref:Roadblock/LC7 domain-containing protein n=1 Tax=Cryptosporidium canis TaxID=195482 RepID=A0A9D5DGR7_9CRYT|nr:hypothetical protein OJ253_2947 [Cryptosporidium canis]